VKCRLGRIDRTVFGLSASYAVRAPASVIGGRLDPTAWASTADLGPAIVPRLVVLG
jgi:hypothetical protein